MRFVKRFALFTPLLGLFAIVLGLPTVAFGDDDNRDFAAHFLGVNETPSISTDATASLRLHINGSGDTATIDYTLKYSGLRAPVTQAHIHFGQTKVMGGVAVFLCGTATNPGPAGTPSCGAAGSMSGTVTGHLTAANVIGPVPQGIAAGEMGRVVRAIRDGAAYGNVHSTQFPAGETRGQLVRTDN
jgi:hypothetical protein